MHDFDKLKLLLDDQYTWPGSYLFKFIVKPQFLDELKNLFPSSTFTEKSSSKGKYTSLTINKSCENSHEVISIYKQALSIESVITL